MRSTRWKVALAILAAAALVSMPVPTGAAPAAPTQATATAANFYDNPVARDIDNRTGTAAPDARQLSLARDLGRVQWNRFGTPHALSPTKGSALAAGLASDPETAARQYLVANQDLFGLDEAAVAAMEKVLVAPIGAGSVVQLLQRFGGLPAGNDGLVSILVHNGSVVHVSSSLTRDTRAPEAATLTAEEALAVAIADAGLTADQVESSDVKLVAVPTPVDGNRAAYAVSLIGKSIELPTAYTTYVDARTSGVLLREDLVDFDSDNPEWAVFPSNAPMNGADNRVVWCLSLTAGCVRAVRDPNSGQAWDVDLATGLPTNTSRGNAANTVVNWGAGSPVVNGTASPTREYIFPFTDQWHAAQCNPTVYESLQRNDIDAAIYNLFAMHNRMHDWAFHLGFTEAAWNLQLVNLSPDGLGNDAEQGRAQAGARSGSRNNANQGTPRDGLNPTTNMFLWQPIAGSSYPPCVDGDYDMTVIGHEYTHAITNRMIAGPNTGIQSFQGGAMGESWSDMLAGEYMFEYGFPNHGSTAFSTGAYVTGNPDGIRNYDMTKSPLNYSNVGYDRTGPGVHADGEIWSATNMRIRNAFLARYGGGTPTTQRRCADGELNVNDCPGNRRWVQLLFDSFLLQASSQFSMLDMRDNMLAADLVRFGGANQDILWNGFAEGGMGQDATSGPADTEPVPSFASPFANNATVTLRPLGESNGAILRLYVGDHEARTTPIADTDPETAIPDTFQIVPSKKFNFLVVGTGYGARRFSTLFLPGRAQELKLNLPRNVASGAAGATVTGPGVNLDKLVDETESTNWASLDGVGGRQLTVDLAGGIQLVREVNVSAMLRPPVDGDADPGAQGSMTALRSFELSACIAVAFIDCTQNSHFIKFFTSKSDAFDGSPFRPFMPDINLRMFHTFPVPATHLRLTVLASQCTGNPDYAGERDADPNNATDCATAAPIRDQVRISEFQVFYR